MSPAANIGIIQLPPDNRRAYREPIISWFSAPDLDAILVYGSVDRNSGAKERLAGHLCASLAGLSPAWALRLGREPLVLKKGPLGVPLLELGGETGPAISYSQAGDTLWAALADTGRVGIDAACSADFARTYPYSRAFLPLEFAAALKHCGGDAAAAAALLWSLKEAAVKALGTGFHCHDPRDVEAVNFKVWQRGWRVEVKAGRPIPAWVWPQGPGWLAIAAY